MIVLRESPLDLALSWNLRQDLLPSEKLAQRRRRCSTRQNSKPSAHSMGTSAATPTIPACRSRWAFIFYRLGCWRRWMNSWASSGKSAGCWWKSSSLPTHVFVKRPQGDCATSPTPRGVWNGLTIHPESVQRTYSWTPRRHYTHYWKDLVPSSPWWKRAFSGR